MISSPVVPTRIPIRDKASVFTFVSYSAAVEPSAQIFPLQSGLTAAPFDRQRRPPSSGLRGGTGC